MTQTETELIDKLDILISENKEITTIQIKYIYLSQAYINNIFLILDTLQQALKSI